MGGEEGEEGDEEAAAVPYIQCGLEEAREADAKKDENDENEKGKW